MSKIGIIHNPFAKGNLRRPWIAGKIREVMGEIGVLRETKNINELPKVAEEFRDRGIDIIAVNGGDGTLHIAISAFVNVYGGQPLPRLMSLRGGTMNTMSNSLKIKGDTLSIIGAAVDRIKKGEPFLEKPQHLLKINDKCGFMSGAGVISKFLDLYYSGGVTGPVRAAKLVSRTIGSAIFQTAFAKEIFSPVPARVRMGEKKLDLEQYTVLLACVIKELGLGFTPTPRAYEKPGHFHFLATDMRPYQVAFKVPQLWLGKDLVHPRVAFTGATPKAVIEPVGKLRYMIDGEMYETSEPLVYGVGPTVTIVTP
jgi:diacylglycerol kinase family enzyme